MSATEAEWLWINEVFIIEEKGLHLLEHDYATDDRTARVEMGLFPWTDPEPNWFAVGEECFDHWEKVILREARTAETLND